MNCQSCGKQRAELQVKESKLWKKTKVLMCQTCIKSKMEPRGFVILAYRTNGDKKLVAEIIKNRRYCGEEITAKELVG